MNGYDEYKKLQKKYIENNKELIDRTKHIIEKSNFPQEVLWAKEVCGELETEKAKTLRINDEFYFTEPLVNNLMLYAFLKGGTNVSEDSYNKGYSACVKDIKQKLGCLFDYDE